MSLLIDEDRTALEELCRRHRVHVAEKLHALTLPRDVENTRARDPVDLAWFIMRFTFESRALAAACAATFERRGTHPWPPAIPEPPASWDRRYAAWRSALDSAGPCVSGQRGHQRSRASRRRLVLVRGVVRSH